MADDKLRIVATVEDQFTGPLSKLEKGLKHVGEETAKQGAAWKKDWEGVRGEVSKFQGVLRGFDPILSAVGVGSFGAALSIAGMVTAVKNFSGQTRDLSQMGRQIGMTVDQLRTLGSLGEKFGVSADTMRGAISQFATNMVDLRQRWGQVYGELRNMNLGHLAEELVNAPSMEAAVEAAMKALQNIPDSMKAARVSTLIFGTPDMATISRSITGKISDALKQTQADIGHLDKETEEAARRFEEHFSRIGRAAENAKLKVLGPVLRNVAGALDQMDAAATDPEGEQIKRLKESRQSADSAVKAAPYGTGWYFERQRDTLDQEIKRLEARRANPAATAVDDKLGSAKAELDYYQNRRLTKDPGREKELAEEIKRLTEELRRLRESGSGTATVQQQSFNGGGSLGGGSLIQKAAWGGFGAPSAGAAIPAYGSPGGGSGGGPSGGGGSGSSGGSGVPSGPDLGDGIRGRPFGGKGALGAPRGALGGEAPIGDRGLLDLIARAEGTTRRGYNDSFAHQVGGDLTGKTLAEIERIQRGMRGSSAIGRYQFMRGTLFGGRRGDGGLVGELGIGRDEKFTPELQDRLANALIERRYREAKLNQARYGGDFMRHFRTALAREWASFPGDYGQRGRNGGMYPGQSASIGRDRLTEGAQRWLDEREGRVADSPSGSGRRPEVLADPNDERRKPDDGGIKQLKPWTKVPALAPTKVDMPPEERLFPDAGRKTPSNPADAPRDGEDFPSFLKRRAEGGAVFGQREDQPIEDPRGRTIGGLNAYLDWLRDNALDGEAETRSGLHHSRIQGRSSDPAYAPERELTPDQIRKFRGPDHKVGDALMDRFYGKGSAGGGPAMQMPGGSGAGGKGSLHIKVDGPPGTQVKADMSDLFGDTTVSHGKSQMSMAPA